MTKYILCLLFAFALTISAQTRLRGNYKAADSSNATCSIKITPSLPFRTPGSSQVVTRTIRSTCDADGNADLWLIPNDTANPLNTYYNVEISSGTAMFTQKWVIPTVATGVVVNIKDVVIPTAVNPAKYKLPVAMLDASTLADGCLKVVNHTFTVDACGAAIQAIPFDATLGLFDSAVGLFDSH